MAVLEMDKGLIAQTEGFPSTHEAAHDGLRRRYFTAAFDSVVRGGASLALYGLTPLVLAHSLGPRDYGIYATITALAALVAGLFHLGQNSALHKLLPQHYVSDRARGGVLLANVVVLTLGIALICCAALFVGADWIATRLYHDATLTNLFRGCAGLILAMALFNLASSVVAGLQDFQSYNTALLVRSLVLVVATWAGVVGWGLWGALTGQFVALGVGMLLLVRSAIIQTRECFPSLVRPDFSWETLRPLANFILPVFLMTLFNTPGYWWANTLLTQTHGFSESGRFSVAYGLTQVIWLAPMSFYVPAMTFLSEAHVAQRADFGALVSSNARTIWLLTLPLALGIALASPLILRLLFGPAYQQTTLTAFALSLTGLLMGVIGLFNTALTAAGRIWQGCAITLGWTAVFVITGLICIPRWGAAGSALTYLISHVFYLVATGLYARVTLQVQGGGLRRLLSLTAAAFAAAAVSFLVWQGVAFYCAGALMLLALLAVEWHWVCRSSERALFNPK